MWWELRQKKYIQSCVGGGFVCVFFCCKSTASSIRVLYQTLYLLGIYESPMVFVSMIITMFMSRIIFSNLLIAKYVRVCASSSVVV